MLSRELIEYYLITHGLAVATFALSFVMVAHVASAKKEPSVTISWLLAIVFVPYLGIPFYFLLAGRKIRRRKGQLYQPNPSEVPSLLGDGVSEILAKAGVPETKAGNQLRVVSSGEAAFKELLALIHGAQRSLHVTTFILGKDDVGRAILDALVARARDGIDVRLIIDAVGSAKMLRLAKRRLREAGGHCGVSMPLLHMPFRGRLNLRNHRKLVIVDGCQLMVGGMNFAEEYMGPTPSAERWLDLAVIAEGPVVEDATNLFASDWEFATNETLKPPACEQATSGTAELQFVASGPDVERDVFYDSVLTAIFAARREVSIVTPYLVPDVTLQRALVLCARRGVETRIIIPERSNHALADYARASRLEELKAAGAKLSYYPKMLHAKVLVFDDLAMVGSPNLDVRSLFLNYESVLLLRSPPEVSAIASWVEELERRCMTVPSRERWGRRFLEPIARLLSPQL